MAFRVRRRGKINAIRIGLKVGMTVIGLWVAGVLLNTMGEVMNGTCSAFYNGLSLIGWTVGAPTATTAHGCLTTDTNTITAFSGSGILAVVGILALASIVTEFVQFSM